MVLIKYVICLVVVPRHVLIVTIDVARCCQTAVLVSPGHPLRCEVVIFGSIDINVELLNVKWVVKISTNGRY